MSALLTGFWNVASSVSIILVNKHLVSTCKFHFILALLSLNFLSTLVFLGGLAHIGFFEVRHLPSRDRWILSVLGVGTVLTNNASNEANSVGFYQITKLLIIPTVIGIERMNGIRKTYTRETLLSLVVSSMGVAIATVSDIQINLRGIVLAAISVVLTAQYQIWQGSKQHEHGLTAVQIAHSVGMPQCVIGFSSSFVLDVALPWLKPWMLLRAGGLLEHEFRGAWDAFWIVTCCLVAVGMNISIYVLMGAFGSVTYQVLGQFKTCLVIVLGYIFFDTHVPLSWLLLRFAGVGIAVAGMISYGYHKSKEAPRKQA